MIMMMLSFEFEFWILLVNAFETAGPKRNKAKQPQQKSKKKWHTSITYKTTRTNNKKLHNIEEVETDRPKVDIPYRDRDR